MKLTEADYLAHYGILRRSGRYPWGSGSSDPNVRNKALLDYISDMRRQGLSDTDIAKGMGLTTTEFRAVRSIAKNEKKQADIAQATALKVKGMSNIEIGKKMGINESSVRALLQPGLKEKADILQTTANMLKEEVASRGFIDVGKGVEHYVAVSRQKLDTALAMLRDEGYAVHNVQVDQLGTKQKTVIKVLAPPGTSYRDIVQDKSKIQPIRQWSEDGGRTMLGIQKPLDVSSRRLRVRYAEDGGTDADGVIYVRPGVEDLSLGKARYAQVRISVDGTHYLKGMAMYKDDLPPGVDLVFNTNKSNTGNKLDALKPQSDDADNPFGAIVRQLKKLDANGKEIPNTLRSAMNIVNEEGNWDEWSKTLSTQMLSKQSPSLITRQLDETYEGRKNQLDEIMRLTNPSVKKKLLEDYADDVDSASIHLKAAAIKGQRTHVILPINSLKETEIYAPNYKSGEKVVLIRYPHGGKFEIPELTVNNNHRPAKKILQDARDAVGVNSKVAERLSGADFDGDTVLVIPNKSRGPGRIQTEPALAGLKNFDPQARYPGYDGMKRMSTRGTQLEMGLVSNLITDMTLKGATSGELARAVRHSMVVIDAEKHGLNYKQSELDNGIRQLKEKYQGSTRGGAATLISRKKKEVDVPKRSFSFKVDPTTGKKVYRETGESYIDRRTNERVVVTQKVKLLSETNNAHTLSSGTIPEKLYANHSNRLKALANQARRESISIKKTPRQPSAARIYSHEVQRLDAALNLALKNAPRERQAQILAATITAAKKQANPDMTPSEEKKLKFLALEEARNRNGAGKERIEISAREWEAIQAGAISPSKLSAILDHADMDRVKQLATPKTTRLMTASKQARAAAMLANGKTQAEVADALGVSLTTLKNSLYGQ